MPRSWFARLRPLDAWGDGNTLIGAALLFNVRIHVISTLYRDSVESIEVSESFGDEYQPTGDIFLARIAVEGREHYHAGGACVLERANEVKSMHVETADSERRKRRSAEVAAAERQANAQRNARARAAVVKSGQQRNKRSDCDAVYAHRDQEHGRKRRRASDRHRDKWSHWQGAFFIPHGDVRASTVPPSTAMTLPNVGPLGGVDGTDACPRCGAWKFPGEKLACCLLHPSGRRHTCRAAARAQARSTSRPHARPQCPRTAV